MITKYSILFFNLISALLMLISCGHEEQRQEQKVSNDIVQTQEDYSIYNLDITLTDQYGEKVYWPSLKGRTTILSMVFTNCTYACPMIVENINGIKTKIKNSENKIRYMLISFDPENDTPAELIKFAREKSLDQQWMLLTGSEGDIRVLSMLLDIKYKKIEGGGFDHSNNIILLDSKGNIVSRSDELGKESEKLITAGNKLMNEK